MGDAWLKGESKKSFNGFFYTSGVHLEGKMHNSEEWDTLVVEE